MLRPHSRTTLELKLICNWHFMQFLICAAAGVSMEQLQRVSRVTWHPVHAGAQKQFPISYQYAIALERRRSRRLFGP